MASTKDLIQKRTVAQQSDALKQQVNDEYNRKAEFVSKAGQNLSLADAAQPIDTPTTVDAPTQKDFLNSPEMQDFRHKVIAEKFFGVETPEEKAKRERNEALRIGYTGLVDGLSSLANLYYTTKWAPNSKRQMAMPQLQQDLYRERLERDKKLQDFRQWQQREAQGDVQRAHDLAKLKEQQNYNRQEAADKYERDMQQMKIKYMYDLGLIDARRASDLEKQLGQAELDKVLEGIRQQNRLALESVKHNNIIDRNYSGGRNRTIRVPIGDDGEYAEYRKDDLTNPIVISQIYNSLPDDYKVRGKEELNIETGEFERPIDDNPSTQKMQEAIGKALSKGYLTEMAPEIQVGGGKKGKKSETKNDKQKKHLNL